MAKKLTHEKLQQSTWESEKVVFDKKNKLYKQKYDQENVFNHAAINSLEDDLTSEEKEDFVDLLPDHVTITRSIFKALVKKIRGLMDH